ncbi:MAG: thioredoxin [Arcobacter sp.]|nr:MAG: thioredoxin [Arcobacter sp.]
MAYLDLTTKNFNETLDNNEIVIIDFWAQWCGPCKIFSPIFEKVAENNSDITFAKIDIDDQSVIAKHYGVLSVPTTLIIRDGIIVRNKEGMLPEETLNELIKSAKALDMDKVRADLDKAEEDDE